MIGSIVLGWEKRVLGRFKGLKRSAGRIVFLIRERNIVYNPRRGRGRAKRAGRIGF